jgi:hypothetical protein
MKVKPFDRSVKNLLEAGFYRIPRFQRPYSWDRANLEDFWRDVNDVTGDYFIGSMVAYKTDSHSDLHFVVDGQQRLTTVTIFLSALRNAFSDLKAEKLANAVQSLICRKDMAGEETFVLQTETSYPYLQEHIQKMGPPELEPKTGSEEDALRAAFGFLTGNVRSVLKGVDLDASIPDSKKESAKIERLGKIRDTLLRLQVIFVELDDEDDAYIIFETLNTRGKDLEVADLVKNFILRALPKKNKNVDSAKDKWNQMRSVLESSSAEIDVNSFIQHYWLSNFNYVTEKQIFKNIKTSISKDEVRDLLDNLSADAPTYRTILEPSYRKKWKLDEAQISGSLAALNLFRVRQQMPMVLAIMRRYSANELPRKDTERLLRCIECFHFLFTAITSQRSSGGISFMYASAARNLMGVDDHKVRSKLIGEFIQKLRDRVPAYEEFEVNFRNLAYSDENTKQKGLVKYVLQEVDKKVRKGETVSYDQMTLEHIGAQNPGGNNPISQESVAEIGNLILVPQPLNNQLGNKKFSEKRQILKQNHVLMDEIILGAKQWTAAEIEKRTKWLSDQAFNKVWKF